MSWFGGLVDAISTATATTIPSVDDIFERGSHHLPHHFTLPELLAGADAFSASLTKTSAKTARFNAVLAILVSLHSPGVQPTKAVSGDDNIEAAKRLAVHVARAITPVEDHGSSKSSDDQDTEMLSEEDEEKQKKKFNDLAQRCRFLASTALSGIHRLFTLTTITPSQEKTAPNLDEVLITLIAYTSREHPEEDTWTIPEIADRAEATLRDLLPAGSASRDQFIIGGILESYLRPLFSKTKRPTTITSSGRKAAYSDDDDREHGLPDDSWDTKPWKFTDHRAMPVFAWAADQADEQLIAKNWPLFIPVLLTLADDASAAVKSRGLKILSKFLAKFPSKTLLETGLAQVFEDAIFPALSYLPSLTPEGESVRLLVPALEALRILARKAAYTTTTTKTAAAGKLPSSAVATTTSKEKENKLLDRVLREGVFPAYFHAKEHVRIVEVLCQQTVLLLQQMGIHAVKHLKDLIPMITTIMTNPFAPLSPSTLLAAIKALQATLATCWPRLYACPWQDEIINSLVICWLNVHDFEQDQHHEDNNHENRPSNPTAEIKRQLTISASALNAVLRTGLASAAGSSDPRQPEVVEHPLDEIISPLVSKEPLLADLFSYPLE